MEKKQPTKEEVREEVRAIVHLINEREDVSQMAGLVYDRVIRMKDENEKEQVKISTSQIMALQMYLLSTNQIQLDPFVI